MKEIFRFSKEYLKPNLKLMLLIIFLTSIRATPPYIFGYLNKLMVDRVIFSSLTFSLKFKFLLSIFTGLLATHLFSITLSYSAQHKIVLLGQKIVYEMRKNIYEKLQKLQMSFFDQQLTGKIMARILDDVSVIQHSTTGTFPVIIHHLILLIIGLFIIFFINWKLSLIVIFTLPFYGISYQIFIKRIREINQKMREKNAEIYSLLSEKISGIRVIKAFAQQKIELKIFYKKMKDYIKLSMENTFLHTLLGFFASFISAAGTVAVLWIGVIFVKNGKMSLGSLLFFNNCLGNLFGPIIVLTNTNVIIQWINVVLKRIFDILDQEVIIKDSPSAIELKDVKGEITFVNVSLKYPSSSTYLFKNLNIHIPAGKKIGLVGPSGSGKSSFVNLIMRFYDPTEGYILFDGHNLKDIKLKSLRKQIGIVPQEPTIFSGTIVENITYGNPESTPSQVVEASKASELHEFISSLPDKYETEIGERGITLSGGQKQRLAIARAILTNPKILILDDASSALDAETEEKIRNTLRKILEGKTSFIITHRLSTFLECDLVVVLDKGEIREFGTPQELLNKKGFCYRLFESQIKK
jgi:subfamily B ATP-binding cassette protein MsbA